MRKKMRLFSLVTLLAMGSSTAYADDAALLNMVRNLESQMKAMQQTIMTQGETIRELKSQPSGSTYMAPKGEVTTAEVGNITEATHPWLKGLDWKGDLRLRYEGISGNGAANTDQKRFRYRLRYGFEKKMDGPFEGDKMKVGFRLASGTTGTRTSTNTTFDTQFDYDSIVIKRAYAKYYPNALKVGPISNVEIGGGKFENPFVDKMGESTWLIWDGDVEPEGLYERFEMSLLDNEDFSINGVATAGQLILEEGGATDSDDSELWAYNLGFLTNLKDAGVTTKHFVSFYDFDEYQSRSGNFVAGNNPTCSGGASLCSEFQLLNVYNEIGIGLPGINQPFKVYFDAVKNLSESADTKATGADQDKAWMLGAKLCEAKKKGQWELKYEYARLEANAVVGAFTDSDFDGGSGNARGSVIGGKYALSDNLELAVPGCSLIVF